MSGPKFNGASGHRESVSESTRSRSECPAEQLQQEFDCKQKEYQEKLQELETCHQHMVEELKTRLQSLQDEITRRKKDQGQLEGEKQSLFKEIKSLKQEAGKKASELEHIKTKLQKKEREFDETKAKLKDDKVKAVSKLEKELSKARETTNTVRQDFKTLHNKNKENVTEIKNVHDLYLDNMKMKNDIIAENEKLCQELKMKETTLATAEFEVRRLQHENTKLNEQLEKELSKARETTNTLRQDFNAVHKKAKDNVKEKKNLHDLYLDNMKMKNDKIAENEKLCQELKMKDTTLAKAQFEVSRLQHENTKLNEQLSKEWSTKDSASDSDLENISIKSRPMNIKGEYEELASQEWLEAKTELDEFKAVKESERIELLCSVLEIAERIAIETHNKVMTNMVHYLQQPLCYIFTAIPQDTEHHETNTTNTESSGVPTKDTTRKPMSTSEDSASILEKELPQQLNNMIRDYVRNKADEVDVGILQMEVNRYLKTQVQIPWLKDFQPNPQFQSYIKACSLLAWKMMLQKPQMRFSVEGIAKPLDEKTQDPYYGSDNPKHPKSVVMYYVTPTLYHTKHMMVKGRVCTKILE